jgi:hypothetical protein
MLSLKLTFQLKALSEKHTNIVTCFCAKADNKLTHM